MSFSEKEYSYIKEIDRQKKKNEMNDLIIV